MDVENELFEYHEEWIKMNDFLEDINLFRNELNDIIVDWKELLLRYLTWNESR